MSGKPRGKPRFRRHACNLNPGKDFVAYSASKAAEAQLAKVVALEGAPHGIRANIVNPDAVFRDSRLSGPWTGERGSIKRGKPWRPHSRSARHFAR